MASDVEEGKVCSSNEIAAPHYNYDSDGEPPTDNVGDKLTIIKKLQVTKEIMETGADLGKPGRPYIVKISYRAYFAGGEEFDRHDTPVYMALGDDRVIYGLWRAIEHMRRGEKSKIMIKPRWGWGREVDQEKLQYPPGWEEGENKLKLQRKRAFYEVKLHDWTVRHDLDGDGFLIKTINKRGVGYDRPSTFDEVKFDLRLTQNGKTFKEYTDLNTTMDDESTILKSFKKIMGSMKTQEEASTRIWPQYLQDEGKDLVEAFGLDPEKSCDLFIDLKYLLRIEDMYRDQSTFWHMVSPGEGSASPSSESIVQIKVKYWVDDELKYEHPEDKEPETHDLEEYLLPACLRRVLKVMKLGETISLTSTNRKKALEGHYSNATFDSKDKMIFKDKIRFEFLLCDFELKDHFFKRD